MPNRNYTKGRRKEYQTMRYLESMNITALRTAGSHGVFDVIGVCADRILLIQVKSGRPPTKAEVDKIRAIEIPRAWVTKQIWFWPDGAKDPEVTTV